MRITPILIAILALPAIAQAGIIHVPGDYPNIQDAIAAAVDGDTVLVAPGTYVENLDFLGRAITVRSDADGDPATHDPVPDTTIVDGNQAGSVVMFQNGEGLDSVLEGFTITNGSGTLYDVSGITSLTGGGVYCNGASPTILGNKITANGANYGAGMFMVQGSAALIRSNTISANKASGRSNSYGAGICCIEDGLPRIEGNEISGNSATGSISSGAAGICIAFGSHAEIVGNTITGNTVTGVNNPGGGILCYEDSASIITHNIISGNSSIGKGHPSFPSMGGGITCMYSSFPSTIADNVIEQNTAEYGGAIFLYNDVSVVERNLISGNRAEGGGYAGLGSRGGGIKVELSAVVITNNVISGNFADDGGGAIEVYNNPDPSFIWNNTIYGNSATNLAGGILVSNGSMALVANTISWNNDAPSGAEMAVTGVSTLVVEYTDLEGGQPSVYVESGSDLHWGAGMIDVDPGLTDAGNGDFRLDSSSPCIDSGNDDDACCDKDYFGNPRVLDGRLDRTRVVDMGACEFDHVHLDITGSLSPGGSITVDTSGTAGLSVFLFAGISTGETCMGRFGCLFLDLGGAWSLTPFGTIPSSVTTTIPPGLPVPLTAIVQELAFDLANGAGNTSNPLELKIE